MRVKLLQRFGAHQPGETVDVDDSTARWLVGINRGTTSQDHGPVQVAAAPGTDGPDPLAGGDGTRLRPSDTPRVERRANHALPVPGSPVQYNAGVREDDGHHSGRPKAKQAARDAREAGRPTGSASGASGSEPGASGKSSVGKASESARKG